MCRDRQLWFTDQAQNIKRHHTGRWTITETDREEQKVGWNVAFFNVFNMNDKIFGE